jgi:cell division transport system permease protein
MTENGHMRILPREKGAAPLDVVIGVMAFLAALALGASMIADRAAQGWRAGLSDRITVQILVPETNDSVQRMTREANAALGVVRVAPGIVHAHILSEEETRKLVEPWLGADALVAELPLPRLIDATVSPGEGVDAEKLARDLREVAPHARVDDHKRWIARLKDLADTIAWSAYGILLLIAVATASTVMFAVRAGLEAHHDVVELLHQMGAQDGFIANAFERHYFVSALGASFVGSGLAAAIFVGAQTLELAGVEAVPFLPPLGLQLIEAPWLIAVPLAAGLIAFVTARVSVLTVLRSVY